MIAEKDIIENYLKIINQDEWSDNYYKNRLNNTLSTNDEGQYENTYFVQQKFEQEKIFLVDKYFS